VNAPGTGSGPEMVVSVGKCCDRLTRSRADGTTRTGLVHPFEVIDTSYE
jgi:hypothetical protein